MRIKLKRRYDQQLIKKLETLQTTDPDNLWNLLKQLKTGEKFVTDKEDLPPLDEMQDHFMKLLQKQTVYNSFNNEKILSLTLVATQKHGIMDLFIQYTKMVLKWTLQIIEESLD